MRRYYIEQRFGADIWVAHVLVEPNIGRDYIDYTEVLL